MINPLVSKMLIVVSSKHGYKKGVADALLFIVGSSTSSFLQDVALITSDVNINRFSNFFML